MDKLDVSNCADCQKVVGAMEKMGVATYLTNIVKSYLNDRHLKVDRNSSIELTTEVP